MGNQLTRRDSQFIYHDIFPKTFIEAITDKDSNISLEEILQSFNMYFLSYNGSKALTRNKVPESLRRMGLWITYVLYDKTVVTEWYASDKIDDDSWEDDSNWRLGSNMLVGELSISSSGNWVIDGKDTQFPARGEIGITPLIRVGSNNKFQVSYNSGNAWSDISDYVLPKIRWYEDEDPSIAGILQVSMDLGETWTNLSNPITNNLKIHTYIGINDPLPETAPEGSIYMRGPYYYDQGTDKENPYYRMWVYAWKLGQLTWVDNGYFTSGTPVQVVQSVGDSEKVVMSQKAVTEEFRKVHSNFNDSVQQITGTINNMQEGMQTTEASLKSLDATVVAINNRLDGVVENYFEEGPPFIVIESGEVIFNEPAKSWIESNDEANHVGDTYTNIEEYVSDEQTPTAGKSWRWIYNSSGTYEWHPISDSDAVKALQEAARAQSTADGKSTTFLSIEAINKHGYSFGDSWLLESDAVHMPERKGDLLTALNTERRSPGTYFPSDWKRTMRYADDIQEALNYATKAVSKVDIEYAISSDPNTPPTDGWSTTPPTWESGKYIWSRTVTKYPDPNQEDGYIDSYSNPVNISGKNGIDGTSVTKIEEWYYLSTSYERLDGGKWVQSPPTWESGKYYWTKTIFYLSNGDEIETDPVCVSGQQGQDGIDGVGAYTLDLSNQFALIACDKDGNIFVPNGMELLDILPKTTATVYYGGQKNTGWVFGGNFNECKGDINEITGEVSITEILSNTASVQISAYKEDLDTTLWVTFNITKVLQGIPGADGKTVEVVSTTTEYAVSDSVDIDTSTLTWLEQYPTNVNPGQYIWTRTVIDFSDNNDSVILTYTRMGEDGKPGATGSPGSSVTVVSIEYQEGESGTEPPTGEWFEDPVEVEEGKYLWSKITFSDGSISYGIAKQGESAVVYSIEADVSTILSYGNTRTPSSINVTQYRIVGNSLRVPCKDHIIKYQRFGLDSSVKTPSFTTEYPQTVSIDVSNTDIKYVSIWLYSANDVLLDTETIPVLADGKAIEDIGKALEQAQVDINTKIEGLEQNYDDIKNQNDQKYTIWFVDDVANTEEEENYIPNNDNLPASDWTTDEDKSEHSQDIFYNRFSGKAWRYDDGQWVEISDATSILALEKAQQALLFADQYKEEDITARNQLSEMLGYADFDSMLVDLNDGKTIIQGGLLKNKFIDTNTLVTKKLEVLNSTPVGAIESLISINDKDKISIRGKTVWTRSDGAGVYVYGRQLCTLNPEGLTFFRTIRKNIDGAYDFVDIPAAKYQGGTIGKLSEVLPINSYTSTLSEVDWQGITESHSSSKTLLDFTSESESELYYNIPDLFLRIEAYSDITQGRQEAPTGTVELWLTSNSSPIEGSTITINLSQAEWIKEPTGIQGFYIYYGPIIALNNVSFDTMKLNPGSRIVLSANINVGTLDGIAKISAGVFLNNKTIGEFKSEYPVAFQDKADTNMNMSNYYGNGFILAKSSKNYIAGVVSEVNNGALAEFVIRNGDNILKFDADGLTISKDGVNFKEVLLSS